MSDVTYEYLVRACELRMTPSGTYYNLSVGPTHQITPTFYNRVLAGFDLEIIDDKVISTNTSMNATEYLWRLPDGRTSAFSEICYFPNDFSELIFTLQASNSCFEDEANTSILYSGIDELNPDDFQVFPNPTSGVIQIKTGLKDVVLEVVNISGQRNSHRL